MESQTVMRCQAVTKHGQPMLPGRIPLVRIPSVLRVLLMQQLHSVVAESLGQYRCGCNGGIEAVAAHDALERDTERAPEPIR